jgi:hypothetical protein
MRINPKLGAFVALLACSSVWFYVQRILIPYQEADAAQHGRPRGILSDLYPRWYGARELWMHGRDPYSSEVTREIQAGYYGRPIDPARPNDPKDQQRFAYPVYVAFLLAPTLHMDFAELRDGVRWLLVALVGLSVALWLRVVRWRLSWAWMVTLLLFTLGSLPVAQGVKLEQLSLAVAGLIAISSVLIVSGHFFGGGVFLALATVKPQLVMLPLVWLLVWAAGGWKRRRSLVFGFASALAVLVLGGERLLPGWIGRFWSAMSAYRRYTASGSVLEVMLTPRIGLCLALVLVAALLRVFWRNRAAAHDAERFVLCLSLSLAATVVLVPMTAPYNQILLIPAVLILVRERQRLRQGIAMRVGSAMAAAAVVWPWAASFALSLAVLLRMPILPEKVWAVPFYSSLAIPPLVAGLLLILSFGPDRRIVEGQVSC